MRLIKGSLVGLVLAGILALAPTAAFAHGGGGGGHGGGGGGFGGGNGGGFGGGHGFGRGGAFRHGWGAGAFKGGGKKKELDAFPRGRSCRVLLVLTAAAESCSNA